MFDSMVFRLPGGLSPQSTGLGGSTWADNPVEQERMQRGEEREVEASRREEREVEGSRRREEREGEGSMRREESELEGSRKKLEEREVEGRVRQGVLH